VDSVETNDLNAGRDVVRARRKSLVQRCEVLRERIPALKVGERLEGCRLRLLYGASLTVPWIVWQDEVERATKGAYA
jgi:hypothetical protein